MPKVSVKRDTVFEKDVSFCTSLYYVNWDRDAGKSVRFVYKLEYSRSKDPVSE